MRGIKDVVGRREDPLGLGPVDDELFVVLAYHLILGRPPDPAGKAKYAADLAAGAINRRNLLDILMTSQEAGGWAGQPVPERLADLEENMARLLMSRYPELAAKDDQAARLLARELKVFSQHGEDGLLLYLFSQIGAQSRTFVEFGISDGRECNAANLALNFGWSGLLMDCVEANVEFARSHYAAKLGPDAGRVKIDLQMVTAENINPLLAEHDMAGEIDLLSIDIDGNDYWVWKAIDRVNPRLVVIEYNASLGPRRAATVRYVPQFDRFGAHPSGYYHGASLAAMAKLGAEKGYVLVGCDSSGANAFLVRRDLMGGELRELTPAECFYPHRRRIGAQSLEQQMAVTSMLEFVEV